MPRRWWLPFTLVVLSSALVVPTKHVVTDATTVTKGATLTKFETFAFEEGGTVSISTREKTSDSSYKIFIASQPTANRVLKSGSWYQFCHAPVNPGTLWIFPLTPQDTKIQIRTAENYYFFLLDCAYSPDHEVDLRYILLRDPDGGQLSVGEVYMPFLYFVFLGLWLFVMFGWLGVWVKDWESVVPIHFFWAFILFLKLFVCIFDTTYWWNYYQNGLEMSVLTRLSSATYSAAEGVTFGCFLFLVSRGWRITRAGVPTNELRNTVVLTVLVFLGMLFLSFYNSGYLWFLMLFLYILIFPRIFSGLSIFSSLLSVQINHLQRFHNTEQIREQLQEKSLIARRIRGLLVVYIIAVILLESILRTLIPWAYTWVPTFIGNSISFLFCFGISWTLRPREGIFLTGQQDLQFLPEVGALWDLKKTLLIQWPGASMSIAYEELYDREQTESGAGLYQERPIEGNHADVVFVV